MVYPTLRQQSQRHKKDENITKIPLFFLYFAHQFLARAFSLKLHCCWWWWEKPNKDKVQWWREAPSSPRLPSQGCGLPSDGTASQKKSKLTCLPFFSLLFLFCFDLFVARALSPVPAGSSSSLSVLSSLLNKKFFSKLFQKSLNISLQSGGNRTCLVRPVYQDQSTVQSLRGRLDYKQTS